MSLNIKNKYKYEQGSWATLSLCPLWWNKMMYLCNFLFTICRRLFPIWSWIFCRRWQGIKVQKFYLPYAVQQSFRQRWRRCTRSYNYSQRVSSKQCLRGRGGLGRGCTYNRFYRLCRCIRTRSQFKEAKRWLDGISRDAFRLTDWETASSFVYHRKPMCGHFFWEGKHLLNK